jgi:hypothetical protein
MTIQPTPTVLTPKHLFMMIKVGPTSSRPSPIRPIRVAGQDIGDRANSQKKRKKEKLQTELPPSSAISKSKTNGHLASPRRWKRRPAAGGGDPPRLGDSVEIIPRSAAPKADRSPRSAGAVVPRWWWIGPDGEGRLRRRLLQDGRRRWTKPSGQRLPRRRTAPD